MESIKPCPFCGSTNQRKDSWLLCNDRGEHEVDIIECLNCDAAAPCEWWNHRVTEGQVA